MALAAAGVVLVVAAIVDRVGLRAELTTLRTARAGMAAEVESASRESLELVELLDLADAVASLRMTTPRWSAVLPAISEGLPDDAVVESLRTRGDSLYLVVAGSDLGRSVDRLSEVPWWTEVRPVGPVETHIDESGTVAQRLAVAMRVDWGLIDRSGSPSP